MHAHLLRQYDVNSLRQYKSFDVVLNPAGLICIPLHISMQFHKYLTFDRFHLFHKCLWRHNLCPNDKQIFQMHQELSWKIVPVYFKRKFVNYDCNILKASFWELLGLIFRKYLIFRELKILRLILRINL